MATWPASLPQSLDSPSFQITLEDNIIRSEVAFGKPKQRPRYTAVGELFSGTFIANKSEYTTFALFYKNNLNYGTDTFTWVHPITRLAATMEFTENYTITHVSGDQYKIGVNLRTIP